MRTSNPLHLGQDLDTNLQKEYPFFKADPPMQLHPDPPASFYQLSFSNFKTKQAKTSLDNVRHRQHLQELDSLSQVIRQKEAQAANQNEKFAEKLLRFKLEIERLLTINRDYDVTVKHLNQENKSMSNLYAFKLEQLKIHLKKEFESVIQSEREETKEQLLKVRDWYDQKVNLIKKEHKAQDEQLEKRKQQIQDKTYKLSIFQVDNDDKQRKIRVHQQKIFQLQGELTRVADKNRIQENNLVTMDKDYEGAIAGLQNRNKELGQMNQQLHQKMMKMKESMDDQEAQIVELNETIRFKDNQIQKLKVRYENTKEQASSKGKAELEKEQLGESLKQKEIELEKIHVKYKMLETELEEFKNRKTEGNKKNENQGGPKLDELRRELQDKNQRIEQLNSQLIQKSQQYSSKIGSLQEAVESLKSGWRDKERELSRINSTIQTKYLHEIDKLNKLLLNKEETIADYNKMLEDLAKSKKDPEPLPKKKLRRNDTMF